MFETYEYSSSLSSIFSDLMHQAGSGEMAISLVLNSMMKVIPSLESIAKIYNNMITNGNQSYTLDEVDDVLFEKIAGHTYTPNGDLKDDLVRDFVVFLRTKALGPDDNGKVLLKLVDGSTTKYEFNNLSKGNIMNHVSSYYLEAKQKYISSILALDSDVEVSFSSPLSKQVSNVIGKMPSIDVTKNVDSPHYEYNVLLKKRGKEITFVFTGNELNSLRNRYCDSLIENLVHIKAGDSYSIIKHDNQSRCYFYGDTALPASFVERLFSPFYTHSLPNIIKKAFSNYYTVLYSTNSTLYDIKDTEVILPIDNLHMMGFSNNSSVLFGELQANRSNLNEEQYRRINPELLEDSSDEYRQSIIDKVKELQIIPNILDIADRTKPLAGLEAYEEYVNKFKVLQETISSKLAPKNREDKVKLLMFIYYFGNTAGITTHNYTREYNNKRSAVAAILNEYPYYFDKGFIEAFKENEGAFILAELADLEKEKYKIKEEYGLYFKVQNFLNDRHQLLAIDGLSMPNIEFNNDKKLVMNGVVIAKVDLNKIPPKVTTIGNSLNYRIKEVPDNPNAFRVVEKRSGMPEVNIGIYTISASRKNVNVLPINYSLIGEFGMAHVYLQWQLGSITNFLANSISRVDVSNLLKHFDKLINFTRCNYDADISYLHSCDIKNTVLPKAGDALELVQSLLAEINAFDESFIVAYEKTDKQDKAKFFSAQNIDRMLSLSGNQSYVPELIRYKNIGVKTLFGFCLQDHGEGTYSDIISQTHSDFCKEGLSTEKFIELLSEKDTIKGNSGYKLAFRYTTGLVVDRDKDIIDNPDGIIILERNLYGISNALYWLEHVNINDFKNFIGKNSRIAAGLDLDKFIQVKKAIYTQIIDDLKKLIKVFNIVYEDNLNKLNTLFINAISLYNKLDNHSASDKNKVKSYILQLSKLLRVNVRYNENGSIASPYAPRCSDDKVDEILQSLNKELQPAIHLNNDLLVHISRASKYIGVNVIQHVDNTLEYDFENGIVDKFLKINGSFESVEFIENATSKELDEMSNYLLLRAPYYMLENLFKKFGIYLGLRISDDFRKKLTVLYDDIRTRLSRTDNIDLNEEFNEKATVYFNGVDYRKTDLINMLRKKLELNLRIDSYSQKQVLENTDYDELVRLLDLSEYYNQLAINLLENRRLESDCLASLGVGFKYIEEYSLSGAAILSNIDSSVQILKDNSAREKSVIKFVKMAKEFGNKDIALLSSEFLHEMYALMIGCSSVIPKAVMNTISYRIVNLLKNQTMDSNQITILKMMRSYLATQSSREVLAPFISKYDDSGILNSFLNMFASKKTFIQDELDRLLYNSGDKSIYYKIAEIVKKYDLPVRDRDELLRQTDMLIRRSSKVKGLEVLQPYQYITKEVLTKLPENKILEGLDFTQYYANPNIIFSEQHIEVLIKNINSVGEKCITEIVAKYKSMFGDTGSDSKAYKELLSKIVVEVRRRINVRDALKSLLEMMLKTFIDRINKEVSADIDKMEASSYGTVKRYFQKSDNYNRIRNALTNQFSESVKIILQMKINDEYVFNIEDRNFLMFKIKYELGERLKDVDVEFARNAISSKFRI